MEWVVTKNGKGVRLSEAIQGDLNAQGGKIQFKEDGEYVLTASMTDYLKRSYSHSQNITVMPVMKYAFTIPEIIHYGTEFDVKVTDAQYLGTNKVVWDLTKTATNIDYKGSIGNDGGKISINDTGEFKLTATITNSTGRLFTHSQSITVMNTAPHTPVLSVEQTRTEKDGKFLVTIHATATDADGDATALEYDGTTADSYYEVGTHTIKVRAKDEAGAYSDWIEKTFTVEN